MQAIVLAGGRGRRLAPYTTILPKPLMPVGDSPILEIVITQLRNQGFKEIIIAVGYLSHLIESYFGDGSRWGIEITYSKESEPLGTAGPLGLIVDQLAEHFIVLNGDLLTSFRFDEFLSAHLENDASATIATYSRSQSVDFGVIEFDANNMLEEYIEKPEYRFSVSMGINALTRSAVREHIFGQGYIDIPDLMLTLKEKGQQVYCYSQPDCIWLDIGRVDDYENAQILFEQKREEFLDL
jgi:NDP-mannose synthase